MRKKGEQGVGVFAELVPSFLTQLLRHCDLWWLGNDKITDLRPRAPDFCQTRDYSTFVRVSIDSAYPERWISFEVDIILYFANGGSDLSNFIDQHRVL